MSGSRSPDAPRPTRVVEVVHADEAGVEVDHVALPARGPAPFPDDPQLAILTERLRDAEAHARRMNDKAENMARSRARWKTLAEAYAADPGRNRELGVARDLLRRACECEGLQSRDAELRDAIDAYLGATR